MTNGSTSYANGSVFTVLADDLYRTDIGYVLTVDTAYGKIISLRTVSLNTYGNNYNYTAPAAPTYGNPYGNGYDAESCRQICLNIVSYALQN